MIRFHVVLVYSFHDAFICRLNTEHSFEYHVNLLEDGVCYGQVVVCTEVQ